MRTVRPIVRLVVALGIASCSIYDSSLLVDASPDVAVEAASPPDASPDVVDSCQHAEPPARPAADDPSDGGDIEIVAALAQIDFDVANDAGVPYGFDLDHTCTCPGPDSCVPLDGGSPHCDEEGGRDNAGGALIQQFSQLTSQLSTSKINENIAAGAFTMLLRVRGYNGMPNDTNVQLAVFASNGTLPLDDAGNDPPPKHDGTDEWSVDPTSVVGTPPPYVAVYEDDAAYVAGGVLVASVSFPFSIGSGFGVDFLRIDGAILAGALTHGANGWALSGVIAGRWDTRNILTGMETLHDPFNSSEFLCGDDPTYQVFKAAICAASDITKTPANDNSGAPCDALSLAIAVTAEPAQLGALQTGGARQSPCGATYSDQCGN